MTKAQKSLVNLVVMLAVAGGVAAYAYFGVFKVKEAEEKTKEEAAKAFKLDKAKAKKVVLTAKGETTTVEKQGEFWMVTAPVQGRADKFAIDAIVDKFDDLKSKEKLADDRATAAEFGLDSPEFKASLTLEDGSELSFEVGAESPLDQSRAFVKGGDQAIYLADSSIKYPLDKSLFDLRDKALVTHEDKDVQAIVVTGGALSWSAERDGEGWKLLSPLADAGDKSTIDGVLSKVKSARAKAFSADSAPADLAPFGLDKPAMTLEFAIGGDKTKKTLALGSVEQDGTKKAFARLVEGSPVWEVEATLVSDLEKKLEDLRDKTVAKFDREGVKKVEVGSDSGDAYAFTRTKEKEAGSSFESEKFKLVGKEDAKLKTWSLSSMLYTLSSLRAAALAEPRPGGPAAYGLDKPRLSISVFGDADAVLAKLLVGGESGTRYFVQREGSDRVFEVEKSTIDGLPKKAEDVIDTPAAAEDAGTPAPVPTEEAK